jgi:hypothetical protein
MGTHIPISLRLKCLEKRREQSVLDLSNRFHDFRPVQADSLWHVTVCLGAGSQSGQDVSLRTLVDWTARVALALPGDSLARR